MVSPEGEEGVQPGGPLGHRWKQTRCRDQTGTMRTGSSYHLQLYTRDDVMNTRDDVMNTRDDVMNTRDDVMNTRDDVMNTRDDVMNTRDDVMS